MNELIKKAGAVTQACYTFPAAIDDLNRQSLQPIGGQYVADH